MSYKIVWTEEGQRISVNNRTVDVVGAYKEKGHLIFSGDDSPMLLSFVGEWPYALHCEEVWVPEPCTAWKGVLSKYEEQGLLAPTFLTYSQAYKWLNMVDSGKSMFGGTIAITKHDKSQGLTISYDGYNEKAYHSPAYNLTSTLDVWINGLWAAERHAHHYWQYYYESVIADDKDDDNGENQFNHVDISYLMSLSFVQRRKHLDDRVWIPNRNLFLYDTNTQWKIELIKAADKGEEEAIAALYTLHLV